MLGYYEVYAGIKGSDYEYCEKIWAKTNQEAEEEFITKLVNSGINLDTVEHCESMTLIYPE